MLGRSQKERLAFFVDTVKRSSQDLFILIFVHNWRGYTRELGKGRMITATLVDVIDDQAEFFKDGSDWIANATEVYTAVDKAREIANYLVSQGVDKDHIRIKTVDPAVLSYIRQEENP